jgi:hypothetical protein
MVRSGFASTLWIKNAAQGESRLRPGGRPCRAGVGDPHVLWRCSSLMAKLSLTPKWRAAARQEWPASTNATTRTRRSRASLWGMIHLLVRRESQLRPKENPLNPRFRPML